MRIATGGISHETSTFMKRPTTMRDFATRRGLLRGKEIIDQFRGTNICTGGFIDGSERHGFDLVPLLWADAAPSGLIVRQDYETLKAEFLQRLRDVESIDGPVDGVLLDMHGAMVVEGIDDGDGDFFAAVRDAIGPDRPIVATHDLHSNHTRRRVAVADAIIGFDTYPHVDLAERGREAAEVTVRTIRGEVRPVMAIHQVPLLWSVARQATSHPPIDEAFRLVHEIEKRPGVLTVTLATGFPWSDVPEVGASVVAVADGDPALAQAAADEVGTWVWQRRKLFYREPLTIGEALAEGERIGKYPIIVADQADNTGGGAPGDSTEVLQTFVDRGLQDALVLYMVDAQVAEQAHAAGAGARISVAVGGKSDPAQGAPVEMEAEVVAVADGDFMYDGPMLGGLKAELGPSAWLRSGGVSVVVISRRQQPLDLALSRSLGLDCASMRYVAVKSANHFRSGFEQLAGSTHNIDAKAIHSHDFRRLKYHRVDRALYPIVDEPTP